MIVLSSDTLLVRVDEAHGAEVVDLIDRRTGRQLLGRPPFATAPPAGGDLDEAAWTRSYRGGWQLLTPNAGTACVVDGRRHGFHGRASNDPWDVTESDSDRAELRWRGHGLTVRRRLTVEGDTLHADVRWTADTPAPFVAVEHIALGVELLDPDVEIELPAGRASEMVEHGDGSAGDPQRSSWPRVALLDGGTERADRWPLSQPRSRLLCVEDLPAGAARVTNGRSGAGVALAWDSERLPHVWVWHEVRRSRGPWRGLTELLVVEPASVPHHLGLAEAIERDQAHWARAGEPFGYRVSLTALPGDR